MEQEKNKVNKVLLILVIILAFTTLYFAFNRNAEAPEQISDEKQIQNTTTPITPDTTPVTPTKKVTLIKPLSGCLPAEIRLSSIVDAQVKSWNNGVPDIQKTTVEQKLNSLKASCNSINKLVDINGKQITFYNSTGCWGMPPPNSEEIMQKQRDEINKLEQQYTVIQMTCNTSGIPFP